MTHFKQLVKDAKLSELLTTLVEKSERSLLSLVLLHKLKKQMTNAELTEIESKSSSIAESEEAIIAGKYLVFKEMGKKGKLSLAEDYLKKQLVHFTSYPHILDGLLLAYSSVVKKFYTNTSGVEFVLSTVKKVAIESLSAKIFSNLLIFLQLNGNPKDLIMQTYAVKLDCSKFKADMDCWLEYISFLLQAKDDKAAQTAFGKALSLVSQKNKEKLIQSYGELTSRKQ